MTQTAIQTYVQALYQNVLLRAGDTGGLAHWAGQAEQGMSSMTMVADFIGSTEAQNIAAVLHLYDVFFDRAADSAGLSHWIDILRDGASLRDIALAFAGSDEFQAKYGALSTAAYVEALYGNLFERAADAGGKAHWIAEIDAGRVGRADAALAFSLSAEAKASDGAATRFAESYLALRSSGVAEPSTAAAEALAHKSLADAVLELQTVHGTVQNGIIQNAHVSRDGNGDGHPDAGASNVSTDAQGNFTIVGGYGDILVSGGTDLTTGKTNDKTMSAPAGDGAIMVTPLTTLIKAIVDQGVSVADAVHKVNLALGLDANFDPLTFDHTANATAANSTQAQQKEAIAIKGAIAQITTLMENVSGLIKGAAGAATDLDVGGISTAVAHALAGQIIAATGTGNAGSPLLALGSADVVKATITAAASGASADSATPLSNAILAKIGELSTDAANMIGALNTVIGATVSAVNGAASFDPSKIVDAFSTIAKAEALGQDTVQAAITTGAHDGSLTGAAASYTGEHLNTAIKAQTIGTIADGVASTSGGSVIVQVTGTPPTTTTPTTGGGGDTPPPATTFTVTVTEGVVQFAGTATGDITVAWTDGVATFSRGGKTATTTADFAGTATKITLASGQNLVADAADVAGSFMGMVPGKTIDGAGTVDMTGLGAIMTDLSHISVATTAIVEADLSVNPMTGLPPNLAGFKVAADATLTLSAFPLAGLTVSGAGNLNIGSNFASNTDLSNVTVTGKVAVEVPQYSYVDISANTHLGVVDEYHVSNSGCSAFTLTADQASHDVLLTGNQYSRIEVTASAGNQTLHVDTMGSSDITPGTGADQVFLGDSNGRDVIVINGAAINQTEEHQLYFHELVAGQSVTVAGLTLTATGAIAGADVAAAFQNLAAGANGTGVAVANGIWSGALTGWNTTDKTAGYWNSLSFVSETPNAAVDDIAVSGAGVVGIEQPAEPDSVATQGVSARTEENTLFFDTLIKGQSVTVAGLTLTASATISAAAVAAAYANLAAGAHGSVDPVDGTWSGTLTNWNTTGKTADSNILSFMSETPNTDVDDIVMGGVGLAPTDAPTDGAEPQTAKTQLTFYDLAAGQSVTVAGLTLTVSVPLIAADVAAAFEGIVGGAQGTPIVDALTWSGALTGWNTTAMVTNNYDALWFVSETQYANVPDIETDGNEFSRPAVSEIIPGVAAQTEQHALTFYDLIEGQSVTVAGLTLTATGAISAAAVAAAFENLAAGAAGGADVGAWSGALTGWHTTGETAASGVLSFESETPNANVDDIVVAGAEVVPSFDSVIDGAASRTEKHELTFHDLIKGQSVTVAGLTLTATGAITAANVALGFEHLAAGAEGSVAAVVNGLWSGALTDWHTTGETAVAGVLSFVSNTANASVDDIVVSVAGVEYVAAPPSIYDYATQGHAAGTASDSTPQEYDVITGFVVGTDRLQVPTSGILTETFDATATGGTNLTIERDATAAFETFAGIKTSMSTGDTIQFVYNETGYTMTLSNGVTNLQSDVNTASMCGMQLGANHVAASFVGDDLVLTAVGNAVSDSLDYGVFTHSGASAVYATIHAATSVLAFGGTAAATASVLDKATALLTAMGTNQYNAVFVDGDDTYVVEGDGVAGVSATDIMVKLAGVQETDFIAITGNYA